MNKGSELAGTGSASCVDQHRSSWNLPCHLIILSQLVVDEQNTLELQLSQPTFVSIASGLEFLHRGLPFALYFFVAESTESYTPTFEDDYLDSRLTIVVTGFPLAYRKPVASSIECRLVVRGHFDALFAVRDGSKRFSAKFDIVGRRLAAMLDERIAWLRSCESFLFVVWKVEIVYREDQGG
jgi:hypothetical protein